MEKIRRGLEFFKLASKQLEDNDSLHDSFFSAFLNQFDNVSDMFEGNIEYNELGFGQINREYLIGLINDPSKFIDAFQHKCIQQLQDDLIYAFKSKKVRSEGNLVDVVWSYIGHRFPNKSSYTIELSEYGMNWRLLSGKYDNHLESSDFNLPLDPEAWYPK